MTHIPTDAEILAIRDDHLPSQGEAFDCLAFARAILAAGAASVAVPRGEPMAWLSTVITPMGTKLQRLALTQEEAEMANATPIPLYAAAKEST